MTLIFLSKGIKEEAIAQATTEKMLVTFETIDIKSVEMTRYPVGAQGLRPAKFIRAN